VSTHSCCQPRSEHQATALRRGLWSSTCLLPAAFLALAPKCPLCLAAYLTLVSGVGISATAAEHVWTGGVVLAVAGLVCLVSRCFRRPTSPEADPPRREAGAA
jgi:hypothetical protein